MNNWICLFKHWWGKWTMREYDDDMVVMHCETLLDYLPAKSTRKCGRCGKEQVVDNRDPARDWSRRLL